MKFFNQMGLKQLSKRRDTFICLGQSHVDLAEQDWFSDHGFEIEIAIEIVNEYR